MNNRLPEQVREFIRLMRSAGFQEAFDRFYDQQMLLVDADGVACSDAGLFKQRFHCRTKHLKAIDVNSIFVRQSLVILEWYFSYDNQNDGRVDDCQISVQQWKNNKIIRERQYRQKGFPEQNLN